MLISDVGGESGSAFVFSNEEIAEFLAMEADNVFSAAALALRTMAANEVLTQKRITFLELKTDGPAEADALLKLATSLEEKAETDSDFEVAQLGVTHFARRELRGLGAD